MSRDDPLSTDCVTSCVTNRRRRNPIVSNHLHHHHHHRPGMYSTQTTWCTIRNLFKHLTNPLLLLTLLCLSAAVTEASAAIDLPVELIDHAQAASSVAAASGNIRPMEVATTTTTTTTTRAPPPTKMVTTVEPQPQKRCVLNVDIPNRPERYLKFNSATASIVLESSHRVSHRLATEVYKILLEEVLNYKKVEIKVRPSDFNVNGAVNRVYHHKTTSLPESIMNVEVWSPIDYETTRNQYAREFGMVTKPGRLGWFLPRETAGRITTELENSTGQSKVLPWEQFLDRKFVQLFEITEQRHLDLLYENSYTKTDNKIQFFCNRNVSIHCTNGTYIPPKCRPSSPNYPSPHCATLLAPDYLSTSFITEHIEQMGLLVRVVWLGDNLNVVQWQLRNEYRNRRQSKPPPALIILTWTPSDVIPFSANWTEEWMSVLFPTCEFNSDMADQSTVGCEYSMWRLVKLAWINAEKKAPMAAEALGTFHLTQDQYAELLQLHNDVVLASPASHPFPRNYSAAAIACDWLSRNNETLVEWMDELEIQKKETVYIGGIFPIMGSSYTGQGIVQGAFMAINAINANKDILPDYTLELKIKDGQCRADKVMKAFIDYIAEANGLYDKLIGVLGPACSDTVEPLAGVSKHFRTMVISYSAEGASLSDRDKYPYFFRTIGENKQYKYLYRELFRKYGWKRFSALTEDGQKYTEYISHMSNFLKEEMSLIENVKFPREKNTFEMTRYLEDLKAKNARIIIADIFDDVARTVMCEAYKLGMTAKQGYVWFLPTWLNRTWYDTNLYNEQRNESVKCSTANMVEAINGYFSITHAPFAPDDNLMQENITVREWRKNYASRVGTHYQASNYAGYAYDAVWTYGLALDKLIKKDTKAMSNLHSENTTDKILQLVQQTDFEGVSGHIKFSGGPSRFSNINLLQWYNNESRIVGVFMPNLTNDKIQGGKLVINETMLIWARGKVPDDGTIKVQGCTLEWLSQLLNTECSDTVIILNVAIALVVLTVALVIVYYIRKQYRRKIEDSRKFMEQYGLTFDMCRMDLDKWEIAREKIVINRKLGEGAFGAVYGGEVEMPEKGWVSVAVKTLKNGSTTEEKLDFLSEAEVMKRFDHNNIVKLLGVCMKSEPIYTVMEFMLFGDLKTFLLARRNLVNDKNSEETDEISSKKLTNMALDVARALSYLCELKFVHRDVASRNCLISNTRTVKLGDFGMTRLLYENDYYRFNRKGMLPVRWMAPESLALGVFTPQSDVWSFGVLLYEIVTFGSFPFQGMTNNQVLDHVKEGNTLKIPKGVKIQLEGLMKSCWNQDYKKRPSSLMIVEYLANNPRLIFPCLEGPTSSVEMDHTGQMEIQLPDSQFRKCSSTLSAKVLQLGNGSIPHQETQMSSSGPPATTAFRSYEGSPVKQSSPTSLHGYDDMEEDDDDDDDEEDHEMERQQQQHQQQQLRRHRLPETALQMQELHSANNTPQHRRQHSLLSPPEDIDTSARMPLLNASDNGTNSNTMNALARLVRGGEFGSGGNVGRPAPSVVVSTARQEEDFDDEDNDDAISDDYMNLSRNGQVTTRA